MIFVALIALIPTGTYSPEPTRQFILSTREGAEVVFRLTDSKTSRILAREPNPDERGSRFVIAVSPDGKRFLRIRPAADGKTAALVVADLDGKVTGEYRLDVGDPAAWWYGWDGDKVFTTSDAPNDKWKLWVQGESVRVVSKEKLPTEFRGAIDRSPNKEFHSKYPESANWTIGYLTDNPSSLIPETPYTFVDKGGIGTFDSVSASYFSLGRVTVAKRPSNLVAWWNVRYLGDGRFLAIGDEKDHADDDRAGRPFVGTYAWIISADNKETVRLGSAVYAVPIQGAE